MRPFRATRPDPGLRGRRGMLWGGRRGHGNFVAASPSRQTRDLLKSFGWGIAVL
jgi:hypothetical protein